MQLIKDANPNDLICPLEVLPCFLFVPVSFNGNEVWQPFCLHLSIGTPSKQVCEAFVGVGFIWMIRVLHGSRNPLKLNDCISEACHLKVKGSLGQYVNDLFK